MRSDYPCQIDKICAEIIVEVMEAARAPSAGDADRLYGELCAKLDSAIRLCEVERFSVDAARELLYPLAALADEVFMAMPQYRARWIANPLQLRYFGEVVAGTAFFSRLEKLTEAPEGKKRQLELYFTCLALGFKGMYGAGGQSGLRERFESLGATLTDMRNGQGVPALASRGNARKKFLSLRKCLFAMFSLSMITVAAFYLPALVDFLKFLENFL
ncbi:MAG: DotU family type IV/VI secretion system protein [Chitinispirillales bacterium]|jgi:type IV/VI secretion system ImpK/VasF family protein|nr:DotU family type IV/VI secretion system protein [Chitinispirillales bacterium]